ncbi:MAG: hypothetical protein K2J90_05630 [Lachnospiraceae bacterium]|nr:hypothetical protein [Lachnospiraceae bacterium]
MILEERQNVSLFICAEGISQAGMFADGRVIVPEDVVLLYDSFQGKEFEEDRKRIGYIVCCLRAVANLYGIVPFSVFMKLALANPSLQIEEEVKAIIANIPSEANECVLVNDIIDRKENGCGDRGSGEGMCSYPNADFR